MHVNISSYLWDTKVLSKKNLFLLIVLLRRMARLRHLIASVYKMKNLYEWLKFCVHTCISFNFFFEELKLLTLSYRSVFILAPIWCNCWYSLIHRKCLLYLQGMQALLGMQSFLWI